MASLTRESYEIISYLLFKYDIPGIKLSNPGKISFGIIFTDADTSDEFHILSISWWRYENDFEGAVFIETLLINEDKRICNIPDLGYEYGEKGFTDFYEIIGEIIRLRNFIAIEKGIPQINYQNYLPIMQIIKNETKHNCVCFICSENIQVNFHYGKST